MEPIYREQFQIGAAAVDRFGRLKPSMMLLYAQEVAGAHCTILSLSYEKLAEKGLFWAVIRNRIQVSRLPRVGETITVETWPMPTTRSAYPRATVAYDEAGNQLFCLISLWVLMDLNSRAMILPGKSGVLVEGFLRGTELAPPKSLSPKPLERRRSRMVGFTDLDRNGHMNNCRYLDWIDDLLSSDFHRDHSLKELTLCYLNEAREGQTLDVTWDLDEAGALIVDIHREKEAEVPDYDRIFAARILFDKVVL